MPYTNRELDSKFNDIMAGLERIETQTTKHNGRLKKGEENWAFTKGALAILTTIFVPMLGYALYVMVTLDSRIQTAIINAAQEYAQDSQQP